MSRRTLILILNGDGSFVYTPANGDSIPDSFTCTANHGLITRDGVTSLSVPFSGGVVNITVKKDGK